LIAGGVMRPIDIEAASRLLSGTAFNGLPPATSRRSSCRRLSRRSG
jgi:hypothetical protein